MRDADAEQAVGVMHLLIRSLVEERIMRAMNNVSGLTFRPAMSLPSLHDVLRANHSKSVVAIDATAHGLKPRALVRALDYIDAHLGETISLQDLADAACTSKFHFARQFRIATGCSPMEFVLKSRIAVGRQMLTCGEQNVSTVAVALGFFDQSHFTRAFRRLIGMPPHTFRRLCAQKRLTSLVIKSASPSTVARSVERRSPASTQNAASGA